MKNQQSEHSNFWLGFLLGAGATGAGLYFFGTSKGRRQLRSALDLTEDLPSTVDDVYHAVVDTYQTTQKQAPKVINMEDVPEDTSTWSAMRKAYGIFKLFSDKYQARKRIINEGEVIK